MDNLYDREDVAEAVKAGLIETAVLIAIPVGLGLIAKLVAAFL